MVNLKIKLPEGFLEPETRCGYNVDVCTKEIWAVELDLLSELLRVCKKYDIKIFAGGGTLLGTVRHNGFIPWDDDIDMDIMRADYEKLCRVAAHEFKPPYFFQTEYTDPGSLRGHAQLRNSETTAIRKAERMYGRFNQGIFIDIFPLDNIPDDELSLRRMCRKAGFYKWAAEKSATLTTRYRTGLPGIKGRIKDVLHGLAGGIIVRYDFEKKAYIRFENTCCSFSGMDTARITDIAYMGGDRRFFKFKEYCTETFEAPFEFISMPVPVGYDEILHDEYGNYNEFVYGTSNHGDILFDTDKPYTVYF